VLIPEAIMVIPDYRLVAEPDPFQCSPSINPASSYGRKLVTVRIGRAAYRGGS
jgi:hypothetical protein